ncbi:MAG: MBL fold metallo-hydrolase [Turicibacter sp.]|nr:MBL fold metallo-hydrolase [Turicibacter sp.]
MRVCVLSSGSIGNATIIETDETCLLIDSGLTLKKLQELIKTQGFDENKIEHMLITHEHSDHIKGAGVAIRKWHLEVWGTEKTLDAMYRKNILREGYERVRAVRKNVWYEIGDLLVMPVRISHDAVDPVGYFFKHGDKSLVYMTDTGYCTGDILKEIANADAYIFETNHNVEMLQMCDRPWMLKQRILSDVGHLSNEDAAYALSQLIGDRTKHIFLAHLSQDANLPDLAMMTVEFILKEEKVNLDRLKLHMTYPLAPSNVVQL